MIVCLSDTILDPLQYFPKIFNVEGEGGGLNPYRNKMQNICHFN